MELVSVTKVIQHLEDGYDSPTVLSGISADLLKKASKELGQYILKTDRGFKLLEDLLYAVQTLVKHDSNTFQCIADVGLIGLIADILQDVIDRLGKDGMIEDLQVIIETLLETANVLGDLDSSENPVAPDQLASDEAIRITDINLHKDAFISAKSQVCQGLCPCMLELLQAKRLDFQVKMEVVKSTNMLLDQCPSAIKESIVQSGTFQKKIKELIQLIKSIGDYEFQVGLVECLIRLFPRKLRQNYATEFIDDSIIRDGFLSIKDREFETDCRIFLNDLNAGMVGSKSIYSIPCVAAFVGNKQLRKPSDTGYDQFWVDFNIGSQRMTLFCEQDSLLSQNSQMDEQLWETVAIYKTDILKCSCCEIQGAIILEVNLKQRVCELYPSQHQDVKDNTVRIEFELEREAEIATAVGKTFSFSEIRNKVSTVVNPIQISIKEVQEQDSQSQLQESEDPEMPYQTNMVPPASQDASLKKRKVSVPSVPMRTPISTPVIPVEKNMSVISNSSISTAVNIKKVSEQLQRVSSASIPVRVSTKDNLESESMSNKDLKPKQDGRENKKQPAKPKESVAPKTTVTKPSISRPKVKTPVVTVTVASSKKTRGKKTAKDVEVDDRIRATEENLNHSDLADPESIPDSAPPVDLVEIAVPKNKNDKKKTSDDSGINLDETSASSINNTSVVNISTSETNRKICQTKELNTDTAITGSSKEKKSSNSQCEKKESKGKDNKLTLKETNSKDVVQLNVPSGNSEAKRNTHNRPARENDDDDDKFDFNSQEDKIPDSLEPLVELNIQPKHAITDTNQSKCSIADKYSAILNAKGSKKKPKESKQTDKSKTNLKAVTEVEQISNVCKPNKSFADLEPSLKELCSIEDTNKANQNKKPSLEKKMGKTLAGSKIKIKEGQKISKVNKEKKVSKKDKSISESNSHENHEVKKETKRELRSRGKNRSYKEVDSSELSDNSADPDVSNKVGIKRNDTETATDPKQSMGAKTDNMVSNELPANYTKKSVERTEYDKNDEEVEQDNSDESSINNSDIKSSPEHNPDDTTCLIENVDVSDRSSDISEDYRFNNSQSSQDLSQLGGMGTVESPDTELATANAANRKTSKKDMSAVNFVTGKSKGKSAHSKANSKSCKEKNVPEKETDDIMADSESENNSIEKMPEVDKKSSNTESKTEMKKDKPKVKKSMTDNVGESVNESENSTNNDSNELEIVKSNVKKESCKKKPKNKTKDLSFTAEERNVEQMEFEDGGKGKFKQRNINSMSKSKGKGFVFQMSYCKSETNYKYNRNRILSGLNSPEKSIGYDPYDFGSQCQNEVDNVNMQVDSKTDLTSRKARKFFKHSRKEEILEEKSDKNENNKKSSKTGKLGKIKKDDEDSFSELRIDLDDSLIKSLTSPKGKYAGRNCSNKENECVKMRTKRIPVDNIDMVDPEPSYRSTKGKNKQKKCKNNRSKQSNEDMTCDTMADSLLQSSPEMESFQTKDDSKTMKRKQKSKAAKGEEANDTSLDSDTMNQTYTLKKGRQSSRKHQNSNSENNILQNTNTSQFKSEISKRKEVDKRTKRKPGKNQTKGFNESTIDIDSGDSLVVSPEHPKSQRLLEQDPVTKKWFRKSDLKDNLKSKSDKNKTHVGNRRSDKMDMRENKRQDTEEELEEKTPSDVEMPEIPEPGPAGPENDEASDKEENRFSKIIKDIVSSRAGTKHNQSKHKSSEKHSKRKSQSNRKTESSEEEDYSKNENEVSFKEFDSEIIDCVMEEVKTPCISASVASTPRVGSARQKHYNPLNISVIKTPNSLSKSVTFHADARDKGSDTESSSEEDKRKRRRQKTRRKKKSFQYKDLSDEEIDREDSLSQSSSRKSISSLLDSSNNISTRSEKSWILERKKTPKPKPKTYKREHRKQPELCQSQTDSSDESEDDNKSTASRSLSMRSGILSLDFPTPSLSSLYKQNRRGDDEENLILTPITPLKLPNSQHKSEDDIEVYQTQENCTVSLNMDKRHLEGEDMDVGDIGSICLSALGVKTPNRYSQDKAVRDADEEISESTTKKLKSSLKTFLGDSGFASGPSSEVRPSRSALKRKYPNLAECESASAASSDEESENEMERSTLVPKKLFKFDHSSILNTMRAQSDTASTCSDTMDDPEQIDYPVQSGITSFISAFGADIQKHLNVKKQKFETLTKNVLKATQKQFSSGWMEQQQYQSNVTDDFQAKMMAELSLLEADIAKMKESEIKSEEFFRGQLETLHNNYLSQRNRLDNLKKMQTSYKDRCRKLQTYNSTNHKTMMDQLRHEMSHLQKKLIEETQKQEMMNVKRGLQNLF